VLPPVLAQISPNPTVTPTLNTGGWVLGAAWLLFLLGALVAVAIVVAYLRYAPRFRREDTAPKSVRAPRRERGGETPRRAVKITGTPVVVPAPVSATAAQPATVGATTTTPAASTAAAATSTSAAAATTTSAAAATTTSAPASAASAPTATASAPASAPIAEAEPAAASAESAPAAGSSPAATPAATAAPREHKEVSLDQETYDRVLAELLEKGTSRRVAEGQARRAAMIAARKKAEG
jgi:hypothetical protein